ncbi:MAG: Phenylacetic acid catabolic protein [Gemmatimonadota bacterium]|nr:Phenylacetic acid catabolic protein [Gemmatimonadota bacterium]
MTAIDPGLQAQLVALSDTKLLLGYHYGEWTFGPPAIEAGIAACSMAQEEFGHTRLLNRVLDREFGIEIDPLADTRPPEAFASIAFLDRPLEDWGELVAANVVVDQALSLTLRSFRDGAFEPIARVVPKMLLEERFHHAHAEGWTRVIDAERGDARDAFHDALSRAARDVAVYYGPPGHDAGLVEEGAKTIADEELRSRLFGRIAGLLGDPAAAGLREGSSGWDLAEPVDWEGWSPERRRLDPDGPEQEMLDELRGTKNVAFKTA